MQETQDQSLGQDDTLEKGMATHSSILAWEVPWTEEPGELQSIRLQSQTRLSIWASTQYKLWNWRFLQPFFCFKIVLAILGPSYFCLNILGSTCQFLPQKREKSKPAFFGILSGMGWTSREKLTLLIDLETSLHLFIFRFISVSIFQCASLALLVNLLINN